MTRPSVRQKRTGTSRIVSHTRHNNEPTLSRNDSPLDCLHLTLAHRYYFCMEESWEHVFVHWHQGNYQLRANCFIAKTFVVMFAELFTPQDKWQKFLILWRNRGVHTDAESPQSLGLCLADFELVGCLAQPIFLYVCGFTFGIAIRHFVVVIRTWNGMRWLLGAVPFQFG